MDFTRWGNLGERVGEPTGYRVDCSHGAGSADHFPGSGSLVRDLEVSAGIVLGTTRGDGQDRLGRAATGPTHRRLHDGLH